MKIGKGFDRNEIKTRIKPRFSHFLWSFWGHEHSFHYNTVKNKRS